MIEAIGTYSALIKGLNVTISATKIVEIRFADPTDHLTNGTRYRVTAEFQVDYVKHKEPRFRAKILSAIPVTSPDIVDFARYKGVFRINESAGGMKEKQGGDLMFYRGDAFSDELRNVALDKTSGWVTVAIPKAASSYAYRAGDLLYVDGKVYHKAREVGGVQTYELCVRAELCHKVDGTEYWERVRAARHHASRNIKKDYEKVDDVQEVVAADVDTADSE